MQFWPQTKKLQFWPQTKKLLHYYVCMHCREIPCSESLATGGLGPFDGSLSCEFLLACDIKESKPGNSFPDAPLSRLLRV